MIVTGVIWLAVAFMLSVFFYRVTITGESWMVVAVLVGVPAVIAMAAGIATQAIWGSKKTDDENPKHPRSESKT